VAPNVANLPALPASPPPGSFIASTLPINTYTIRLRDNNTGCIIVDTTHVKNFRQDPIPVVVIENPLTNCDTRLNGQMSASADGRPTAGYDFSWWSAPNPPPGGPVLSTNDKLIGVDQGQYEVLIVNKASGCDTVATGTVGFVPVYPPAPDITLLHPQTICWENFYPADPTARPDGALQASVGGVVLGYRFDWYTGSFDRNGVVGLTPDTTGINFLHLTGKFGTDPGVYSLSAVILETGCYSVTTKVVPDERVIPEGIITTTASFCPDVGPPGFTGNGSVTLELTNDVNVSIEQILWYDNLSNASVGDGTQVFSLPPGFYRAEFRSTQFCEGQAVGEIKTEVKPYNLVSSNGDNENDSWVIDCISNYPKNNVKIFNRYGVLVYEGNGYDNQTILFRGVGENGLYAMGNNLPDGTYFYVIDKRDGSKPLTGFLELVR
jgi:gliding motility-associated-like protein